MSVRTVLQKFAHLLGNLFRVFPRTARFQAARRCALALAPWLRRSPYYRHRPSTLDGAREEAMRMLLRAMTRARVEFDVDATVEGAEHVPDGAMIFVSAHFLLNVVITRWTHDAGRTLTPVLGTVREPIYRLGTRVLVEPIYSGPRVLLQARQHLARGECVFADLDNTEPSARAQRVDTAVGPRFVSPALLQFAARHGTPVVFVATHFDSTGRVVMRFSPLPWADADASMREYVRLFTAHAAQVQR